jgi:uncharacterized protein YbjT (DUF2867 family)
MSKSKLLTVKQFNALVRLNNGYARRNDAHYATWDALHRKGFAHWDGRRASLYLAPRITIAGVDLLRSLRG